MTVNGLAEPSAARDRLNTEILVDASIALAKFFRPSDGWLAFLFLTMNLWVVIFSVEQAEWVTGLELTTLLSLSIITGLIIRSPTSDNIRLKSGMHHTLGCQQNLRIQGLSSAYWHSEQCRVTDVAMKALILRGRCRQER